MASIDANLCSLSAEVRSFLSRTIEWPVMNVAADQDSTSNDSVQPEADRPGTYSPSLSGTKSASTLRRFCIS